MKVEKIGSYLIDKNQFQKWITALRSGEYKQTKSRLQDHKGYCCLGVACRVINKKNSEDAGILIGVTPDEQRHSPTWLKMISRDVDKRFGSGLVSMNDVKLANFDEIADILELVYVHGALED